MNFSFFADEKNLYILHEQVFVTLNRKPFLAFGTNLMYSTCMHGNIYNQAGSWYERLNMRRKKKTAFENSAIRITCPCIEHPF